MAARRTFAFGTLLVAALTVAGCSSSTHGGAPTVTSLQQNDSVSAGHLVALDMVSSLEGWALTPEHQVLRTTDGGSTWQVVTPPDVPRGTVSLASAGADNAWLAVGSRTARRTIVYATGDGGAVWSRAVIRRPGLPQLDILGDSTDFLLLHQAVSGRNEGICLLRTTDGGRTWRVVKAAGPREGSTLSRGQKSGVSFADPSNGWIAGNWGGKSVVLYVTHDGGALWTEQHLPAPPGIATVKGPVVTAPPRFFGKESEVLPVLLFPQGMVFYRTNDGGTNWVPGAPIGQEQYSIASADDIFATDGQSVYRSTDGGGHWTVIQPTRPVPMDSLDFLNGTDGWASGGGQLLRTTDGGLTWVNTAARVVTAGQLLQSAGFSALPNLRLIGSGGARLWSGKDGAGPFTAEQLGLTGGLSQTWIAASAIEQYGNPGLVLPLPANFVAKHPGKPLEVYVTVLKFNNAHAPIKLLNSPAYNRNAGHPKLGQGGWAYQSTTVDTGETAFMFQWAHGEYWNQVTVLGYRLPFQAARQLAASIGE